MATRKTAAKKATAKRKPAKAKTTRKAATAAKKPARKTVSKAKVAKKPAAKATRAKVAKTTTRTSARAKAGGEDFQAYSGKFTVRLPKSLHQMLVQRAEKEGVSLNLFVTNALSRTVGSPSKKR